MVRLLQGNLDNLIPSGYLRFFLLKGNKIDAKSAAYINKSPNVTNLHLRGGSVIITQDCEINTHLR